MCRMSTCARELLISYCMKDLNCSNTGKSYCPCSFPFSLCSWSAQCPYRTCLHVVSFSLPLPPSFPPPIPSPFLLPTRQYTSHPSSSFRTLLFQQWTPITLTPFHPFNYGVFNLNLIPFVIFRWEFSWSFSSFSVVFSLRWVKRRRHSTYMIYIETSSLHEFVPIFNQLWSLYKRCNELLKNPLFPHYSRLISDRGNSSFISISSTTSPTTGQLSIY